MLTFTERTKLLCETAAPSGFEERIAKVIRQELMHFTGEVITDTFGNMIYAHSSRKKRAKRLMLTAHMDEIGFMVEHIEKNGLLQFVKLGMIDDGVLSGQGVKVLGHEDIPGIIGTIPPHIKAAVQKTEPFIDAGFSSTEEATRAGVRVGTPVVFDRPFCEWPSKGMAMGKALDDRVGCAILIEVIHRLSQSPTEGELYAVFTVQEEVGLRGSRVAAEKVKPDLAITLDMVPAFPTEKSRVDISQGPVLRLLEQEGWNGLIAFREVTSLIEDSAKGVGVPLQLLVRASGMTDASAIHRTYQGIPACSFEVPLRYEHSPLELMKWDDAFKAIEVLVEVCRRSIG